MTASRVGSLETTSLQPRLLPCSPGGGAAPVGASLLSSPRVLAKGSPSTPGTERMPQASTAQGIASLQVQG